SICLNFVNPGYFAILRSPLLQGRDFDGHDLKNSAHVAIVNETAVRKLDRKSTRLNSSHLVISYAVFCLKKKNKMNISPHAYLYFFHRPVPLLYRPDR